MGKETRRISGGQGRGCRHLQVGREADGRAGAGPDRAFGAPALSVDERPDAPERADQKGLWRDKGVIEDDDTGTDAGGGWERGRKSRREGRGRRACESIDLKAHSREKVW